MFRRGSLNLPHNLWIRESNLYPGRLHAIPHRFRFHERNFFKSITPRLTIQNVYKPLGNLRRFSPDGRLLLAFTLGQRSLDIYEYQGICSVAELLGQQQNECITTADLSFEALNIRQELFNSLFIKKFHLPIITTPINPSTKHFLCRDFSIFLDDGNYVLLSSMLAGCIFPDYLSYHLYPDMFDDTELFDYTFYLIDLKTGRITDTLKYDHDHIVLTNNHSVSAYGRIIAIMSTYRQCVELLKLNTTLGQLERLFILGPFGSNLDRDRILEHHIATNYTLNSMVPLPFSHVKQKVLAFMYREVMLEESLHERQNKLKNFYKNFPLVERAILLKMQLIDSDNILLRFDERPTPSPVELFSGESQVLGESNFKYYVYYDFVQQKVWKIFNGDSLEMLNVLRNHCDAFRNVYSLQLPWHASSPNNCVFCRAAFDRAISSYSDSAGAAHRFNPTLPISAQSFSTSPYLDYHLFNYDDRFISSLLRPRLRNSDPISFYDRATGVLNFRVFLEQITDVRPGNLDLVKKSRDMVTFIFHPYEPFFISVQKILSRHVINFHMYNSSTITKK